MKKISTFVGGLALTISITANAGLYATTAASRANCGNNESVLWNGQESFVWRTISTHQHVNGSSDPYWHHLVDTGWNYTWRSAAVHQGEAPEIGRYKWDVEGYYFYEGYANGKWPFTQDYSRDCSLYDGWWG